MEPVVREKDMAPVFRESKPVSEGANIKTDGYKIVLLRPVTRGMDQGCCDNRRGALNPNWGGGGGEGKSPRGWFLG